MDSQDLLAITEVMENKELDNLEDFEQEDFIIFVALKNYLSYLTNNGGSLKRAIKVTNMLEKRMPYIKEYVMYKLKES